MKLAAIKQAIISTLGAGAGGQFRVVGYKQRSQDELTIKSLSRSVQVVYEQGEFPRNMGSLMGPPCHEMTFAILMSVSSPCKIDVATLESSTATAGQRAAALAAIQDAEYLADQQIDDLWNRVFNIINDTTNVDFGLSYTIGSRELNSYRKLPPKHDGQYVVIQANASLKCQVDEVVPGDTPLAAEEPAVNVAMNFNNEATADQGAGAYAPKEYDNGNSGAAKTIVWSRAELQSMTLTGNCTVSFTLPDAATFLVVRVDFSSATSYTLAFPSSVVWATGAPSSSSCNVGMVDYYYFLYDGFSQVIGTHHQGVPIV